jgi:hypothetical protein
LDVSLARFRSDRVPQVVDLGLADPEDAAEPLLDPTRVPFCLRISDSGHQMTASVRLDDHCRKHWNSAEGRLL